MAGTGGALALDVSELFPIAEALHILEFAELKDGGIKLRAAGRLFAQSVTKERKRLFSENLLRLVPLASRIPSRPQRTRGPRRTPGQIESELEDHLNPSGAEKSLPAVIGRWRYAEFRPFSGRDLFQPYFL